MKLPYKISRAARSFNKSRADYYSFLVSIMRSSSGQIKLLQLFENDMQRYDGSPRGVLCEYWHEAYSNNGGNLSDAWQGTLPDDELAILRVAQAAGGDAILVALEDLSRIAGLTDRVKRESLGTLITGLIGIMLAVLMLTAFPVFSINALRNAYDFLPLDNWGTTGKSLYRYSEFIKSSWIYLLVIVGIVFSFVNWSIQNLTGPVREWLDEHVVLYRAIRDLKGAMFLATMSTLTRYRGHAMFTLKQSLEAFASSATSPWLSWRIEQIIDNSDATGAVGVESFKTGLINNEMFYFLEDMQKAKGFAEGFHETGQYVERVVLNSILKRMTFYRWGLLIIALLITGYMFAWQFKVIYEMRGAMSTFLATGH